MKSLLPIFLLSACGPTPLEGSAPSVTWTEHIAPIVEDHCVRCHAAGRLAGTLPMQTYPQVAPLAARMAQATRSKTMPPWNQDSTSWCATDFHFLNDLRLDESTLDALEVWAAEGAPEGSGHAPLVPPDEEVLPDANHALKLPPVSVPADGVDDLLCVALDPERTGEAWLEGVAVEAGDPEILHHAGIRIVGPDGGVEAGTWWFCNSGAGVSADYVGTYAPGSGPSIAPEGTAMHVPEGALLVVNLHYHPAEDDRIDRSRLHLRWADQPPERVASLQHWPDPPDTELEDILLPSAHDTSWPELFIPAGVAGHVETIRGDLVADPGTDYEVWQVASHMHLAGVEARIWAEHPDGSIQCLLHLPSWDFDWQRMYRFAPGTGPVVPGGSTLYGSCTYDNTLDNPAIARSLAERGLSAPVDIRFGPETTDEMCMFMVGTVPVEVE